MEKLGCYCTCPPPPQTYFYIFLCCWFILCWCAGSLCTSSYSPNHNLYPLITNHSLSISQTPFSYYFHFCHTCIYLEKCLNFTSLTPSPFMSPVYTSQFANRCPSNSFQWFSNKCLREGLPLKDSWSKKLSRPLFWICKQKNKRHWSQIPRPPLVETPAGRAWLFTPLLLPTNTNQAKHSPSSHWQPRRGKGVTKPVWWRFWTSGKAANFASICTGLLALQAKD